MESSWFKSRLTPAKQNSVLWSPLATMMQSLFASFVDPSLERVSNKKSIFTMADEDLDTKIAELGKFFTIRTSNASSKPMLLQQRLDELHFKGTDRPITQTFYREFDGIPITWQPLYAPVDIDTYAYGSVLISSDTLDSVADIYGDMFLTSRGVISVSINDLMEAIDSGELELDSGETTQSAVTEAALTRFNQYIKPLLPCHIVFDGLSLFISVTATENEDTLSLLTISDAKALEVDETADSTALLNAESVISGLPLTTGTAKEFNNFTFDRQIADGALLDSAPFVVLDLTADDLDDRVTFTGPEHYYWNADGELTMSSANEWPLEYADGVAVGRHEPEKAATNFQTYGRADTAVSGVIVTSGAAYTSGTGPDGGTIGSTDTGETYYAVYDSVAGTWIFSQTDGYGPDDWTRYSTTFNGTSAIRTYIARKGTGNYLYAATSGLDEDTTYITSHFRKLGTSELLTGLVQVEEGNVTTSPIITSDAVASREASSVVIDMTGYNSVVVTFSDGSIEAGVATDGEFALPLASLNWGDRYIVQIELKG